MSATVSKRLGVKNTRPGNASTVYWISVGVILLTNVAVFWVLTYNFNVIMGSILLANIAVFGVRAVYAFGFRDILFNQSNYREAEGATNAERVGLYAFSVVVGGGFISAMADGWFTVDDSLPEVGESIMLLILITPVATYLSSGYGKFRDIVDDASSDAPLKWRLKKQKWETAGGAQY